LRDDAATPVLDFSVHTVAEKQCWRRGARAFDVGSGYIGTIAAYMHEVDVAKAITKSDVFHEDVFMATTGVVWRFFQC